MDTQVQASGLTRTDGGRTAMVVLGMHRSGTSALATALLTLGYAPPHDLMPSQSDNPDGFCEPLGVVRLNNRILERLGLDWSTPNLPAMRGAPPCESRDEIEAAVTRQYLDEACAVIDASYAGHRRIMLKDPRVCLLPGLWAEALERAGFEVRPVLVHRNLFEVAESLRRRNGFGLHRSQKLWLRYNLRALEFAGEVASTAVLSFAQLLERGVEGLADALGEPDGARPEPEEPVTGLKPELRHHRFDDAIVASSPLLTSMAKQTAALLQAWPELDPRARRRRCNQLRADLEEACLFAGDVTYIEPARLASLEAGPGLNPSQNHQAAPGAVLQRRANGRRNLVLHYHLFKNAGTSVDAILKRSFGAGWASKEFSSAETELQHEGLAGLVLDSPHLAAVSSHTLNLPVPALNDVDVLPIIFVRHPLVRLKSAYEFERRQTTDTDGSRLARGTSFAGYLESRLERPGDRACRNFQTYRFAQALPPAAGSELDRALRTAAALPFVGLVEAFDVSMTRFAELAQARFPGFSVFEARENVSDEDGTSLDDRLGAIRRELGLEMFARLEEANADDMALYREIAARYGAA